MKNLNFIIYLCILFFSNCEESLEKIKSVNQVFSDGSFEHQLITNDSVIVRIGFTNAGELDYVINKPYLDGSEQRVYFSLKNGMMKSKLKVDSVGITQDFAYYFFPSSGNLSSSYSYVNGLKVGSAISYHDSSDHIKEVMLYNKGGEMYYRKTFDWQGNHIKTEGSKESPTSD